MTSGGDKDDKKSSLEMFDGTDPSKYRKWRRKAELYLMGLPTTVPETKWGARLLEHVTGEAEEVVEHLAISTITSKVGHEKIFELLDEKYKELTKDELQRCLKDFFYASPIKSQESFRNYIIKLDTAYKGLVRHNVDLPAEVRGWILMRKLSLDATSEALLLTATKGSIKYDHVVKALRDVFPHGQGNPSTKSKDKEVFLADDDESKPEGGHEHDGGSEEPAEVMEIVASQVQENSDYESEDGLEIFETYMSVRKKIQEKKIGRGYKNPVPRDEKTWKLEGSIRGKIELLKQKTRCHHCRRVGHWKKECPLKVQAGKKSEGKVNAASSSEVNIIEEYEGGDDYFESFMMETSVKPETGTIKETKEGGPETKMKGKNKRDEWRYDGKGNWVERIHHSRRKGLFTPHGVKGIPVSENMLNGERITEITNVNTGETQCIKDNFHTARVPHQCQSFPWIGITKFGIKSSHAVDDTQRVHTSNEDDCLLHYEQEVLSVVNEGAQPSFASDESAGLDSHAVPDTACRRTLIGDYVLSLLESRLAILGYRVTRHCESNEFRFGNAGLLKSSEVAKIPVTIGTQRLVISAAVLPEPGSRTLLLLSKELLKCLGCVIDTDSDELLLKRFGQKVKMGRTSKGHYAIPILPPSRSNHEQNPVQEGIKVEKNRQECHVSSTRSPDDEPGSAADGISRERRAERDLDSGAGQAARCQWRRTRIPSERKRDDAGRQVQREEHHGGGVPRQESREVGSQQHQRPVRGRDETISALCGDERPSEDAEDPSRTRGTSGSRSTADAKDESRKLDCDQGQGQTGPSEVQPGPDEPETWTGRRRLGHRDERIRDGHGGMGDQCRPTGADGRDRERMVQPDRSSAGEPSHEREDGEGRRDHGDRRGSENVHELEGGGELDAEPKLSLETCKMLESGLDEIEKQDAQSRSCDVMIISQRNLSEEEVAEVFSIPRVSKAAKAVGLKCGSAYDIKTGVDLASKKERDRVQRELRVSKPKLLIVCPPCEPFSPLQNFRKHWDSREWLKKLYQGKIFLRYAMQLCEEQMGRGDLFVFEHPLHAKSWKDVAVERVRHHPNVQHVRMDQCMFGLKDRENHKPHQKSTGIMTNSKHIAEAVNKLCDHSHEHQPIMGSIRFGGQWIPRSRLAQEYPRKMVNALLGGFLRDREERRMGHAVHCVLTIEDLQQNDERKISTLLKRCHENLGHPSTPRFLGMLKAARATEQVLRVAKGLSCTTCDMFKNQSAHHVSKPTPIVHFNDVVAVDVFEIELPWRKVKMLNIIDIATHYQMCIPLWNGIEIKRVRKAYRRYWKRWAGPPEKLFLMEVVNLVNYGLNGLIRTVPCMMSLQHIVHGRTECANVQAGSGKQLVKKPFLR